MRQIGAGPRRISSRSPSRERRRVRCRRCAGRDQRSALLLYTSTRLHVRTLLNAAEIGLFVNYPPSASAHARRTRSPSQVRRHRAGDQHDRAARVRRDATARHHQSDGARRDSGHACRTENEFAAMMSAVRTSIEAALDIAMACSPAAVVLGMSAETFWEGTMDANALQAHLEGRGGRESHPRRSGLPGGDSALRRHSPHQPDHSLHAVRRRPGAPYVHRQRLRSHQSAGTQVQQSIADGPRVARTTASRRTRGGRPSVELILQVGTNLAFAKVAAEAERWLGKPVLAVNTCTYWHALRTSGVDDKIDGFGSLLTEH